MSKQRIWEILEISKENDKQSKVFDYFISILIGLNVVAIILETEKNFFGLQHKIVIISIFEPKLNKPYCYKVTFCSFSKNRISI